MKKSLPLLILTVASFSPAALAQETSIWGAITEMVTPYVDSTTPLLEEAAKQAQSLTENASSYANQALTWSQEDFENHGKWRYKVEVLSFSDLNALENRLNALGNEKWEWFFARETDTGLIVILRQPVVSYLSSAGQGLGAIPLMIPSVLPRQSPPRP